jgi:hypothetical protein
VRQEKCILKTDNGKYFEKMYKARMHDYYYVQREYIQWQSSSKLEGGVALR